MSVVYSFMAYRVGVYHHIFKLRDRQHLGLIRSRAGTEYEEAAIWIVEFYLKDI